MAMHNIGRLEIEKRLDDLDSNGFVGILIRCFDPGNNWIGTLSDRVPEFMSDEDIINQAKEKCKSVWTKLHFSTELKCSLTEIKPEVSRILSESEIFTENEIDQIIEDLGLEHTNDLMAMKYYLKHDDGSPLSDDELAIVVDLFGCNTPYGKPEIFRDFSKLHALSPVIKKKLRNFFRMNASFGDNPYVVNIS